MKIILVLLGVILLGAGGFRTSWWLSARQEFATLATSESIPDQTALETTYPKMAKVLGKLEVDLFSVNEASSDPAELALDITSAINQRIAGGIAACLAGLVLIVVGVVKKATPASDPPKPAS